MSGSESLQFSSYFNPINNQHEYSLIKDRVIKALFLLLWIYDFIFYIMFFLDQRKCNWIYEYDS